MEIGRLDPEGWLYFVDRKRDVIRRGGENVSSVAVEKVLREHPAVAEAAVIGVPDPVLGQEIMAYVVARTPVDTAELEAFAAARLARFQVPRAQAGSRTSARPSTRSRWRALRVASGSSKRRQMPAWRASLTHACSTSGAAGLDDDAQDLFDRGLAPAHFLHAVLA